MMLPFHAPFLRRVFVAGIGSLLASCTAVVWAQTAAPLTGTVRDPAGQVAPGVTVTVTGAASGTLLTAMTLEQLEARNIEGLTGVVPTLTIAQHTGLAQVTILGIGSNAVFAGSDPSTTIHIDGVYLARPAMAFADFLSTVTKIALPADDGRRRRGAPLGHRVHTAPLTCQQA